MGIKYFTLLTLVGEKKLAAAIAAGKPLELVQMGVGDGNGVLPTPDSVQTRLVNERRRGVINSLTVDPNNSSQMIAEQVIPENEGGFWLREIGLYDVDGDLIAVGNCPETYKPELKEGSGRVQTVRMVLIVSHTDAVTLKFDPTVSLASRQYVDDKTLSSLAYTDTNVIEVKSYTDNLLAEHIAAANPHKQYAPLESPAFTGIPTAPTAAANTNSTQIASTAFVQTLISALTSGAPSDLNTLKKLADAIDGKLSKSANGADIPNISAFLANLGLSDIVLAGTISGNSGTIGGIRLPVIISGVKKYFILQWGHISNFTENFTPGSYELEVTFPYTYSELCCNMAATYDDITITGSVQSAIVLTSSNRLSKIKIRAINAINSTTINYFSIGLA
ncbi:phage tail protein [Dickeya fangzhongdai]|uniref:phage tail protein n=1 Tax=Dickeya fangzhongdai TaxID=1778540 RepID=UPI000A8686BC|nr:phage tail protein [Dickeya fangzhongdai]